MNRTLTRTIASSAGLLAGLAALISVPATAAEPAQFIPLGVKCGPAFFPRFCVIDLSGDGKTILYNDAVWTEAGGMTPIGGPPEGFQVVALSDDGSTVVGTILVNSDTLGFHEEAAIWRGGDSWQALGGLPGAVPCGSSYSASYDVSGDGKTVVGLAWLGSVCSGAHAFSWTEATGMVDLGSIVADRSSRANGISADGKTIIGWSDSDFGGRLGAIWEDDAAPRWFEPDGSSLFAGEAQGASSDGSVVVGGGFQNLNKPYSFSEPWKWTEASGVVSLGGVRGLRGDVIDGQHYSQDVSDDGKTVVGQVTLFLLGEQSAWIWTQGRGNELLQDYVRRNGTAQTRAQVCAGSRGPLQPCNGWKFWNVAAISNDGSVIVGTGANPDGIFEAFMIKAPR